MRIKLNTMDLQGYREVSRSIEQAQRVTEQARQAVEQARATFLAALAESRGLKIPPDARPVQEGDDVFVVWGEGKGKGKGKPAEPAKPDRCAATTARGHACKRAAVVEGKCKTHALRGERKSKKKRGKRKGKA